MKSNIEVIYVIQFQSKYEERIRGNVSMAKANGIMQTPTFVLVNSEGGHHIIKGVATYSVFEKVIGFLTK